MVNRTLRWSLLVAVAPGILAAAWLALRAGDDGAGDVGQEVVTVLCAASAAEALEAAAMAEGATVRLVAAGSNTLAAQVIAGAPGDLFLSANPRWADAVVEAGLAESSRPLLRNRLVLVVPVDPGPAATAVERLGDLAGVRRIALAGDRVPAGIYAEQALRAHGVYESLRQAGAIVRGEDVRKTLAYVERGEVDAGVVYATDAALTDRVRVVASFDVHTHDPIVYVLVRLRGGGESEAAIRLESVIDGPAATDAWERYGFMVIPRDPALSGQPAAGKTPDA